MKIRKKKLKGDKAYAASAADPNRTRASTRAVQNGYLKAFAILGNNSKACDAVGVNYGQPPKWRREDKNFQERFELAEQQFIDSLEFEAVRRAREGTAEYVTFKGKIVMVPEDPMNPSSRKVPLLKKNYSDQLMMFILKGANPNKYREVRSVDLTSGGQPIYKEIKGVSLDDL